MTPGGGDLLRRSRTRVCSMNSVSPRSARENRRFLSPGAGFLTRDPHPGAMFQHEFLACEVSVSLRTVARSLALVIVVADARHATGGSPLLELKVGETAYVGKKVAHDDQIFWLAAEDGRLTRLVLKDVTGYRKLDAPFRNLSVVDARSRLARELGQGFETTAVGPYVVAGPRGRTQPYAELLDSMRRSFSAYCSRRSFGLAQPEYPLIAIVFPDRAAFARYCRNDGIRASAGLRGYYHPESNRIVLFDDGESLSALPAQTWSPMALLHSPAVTLADIPQSNQPDDFPAPASYGTIDAGLKDTLVHEATHQLAFNFGLHSRIGESPRWIVEGLAMLLEEDGHRSDSRDGSERDRINRERYRWFVQYVRGRRQARSLQALIASDEPFSKATLDAYSEAWALTFYLAERRSADLAAYLRQLRTRDPLKPYPAEDRLADFQHAFGKDIDWLEVQLLRFTDDLK